MGSSAQQFGDAINMYLGTAHGFIYIGFVFVAFALSRLARWSITFTLVTLVSGTIPILSFWAEHRAVRRVQELLDRQSGDPAAGDRVTS